MLNKYFSEKYFMKLKIFLVQHECKLNCLSQNNKIKVGFKKGKNFVLCFGH